MVIYWGTNKNAVRVLLDTGCSAPIINKGLVELLDLSPIRQQRSIPLRTCLGEEVPGADMEYTKPILLQDCKHFTHKVFDIMSLKSGVDLFLPFWWITKHPPQGASDSQEMRFSSPNCLKHCTRYETATFLLTLDKSIINHPRSIVVGYVTAITKSNPTQAVPEEFHEYLAIMVKEAANTLPEHKTYDCKTDLMEGETAPWRPTYPLSEIRLQTLREWLNVMLRIGKIQWSTYPAGSPVLFVPKPHRHGRQFALIIHPSTT